MALYATPTWGKKKTPWLQQMTASAAEEPTPDKKDDTAPAPAPLPGERDPSDYMSPEDAWAAVQASQPRSLFERQMLGLGGGPRWGFTQWLNKMFGAIYGDYLTAQNQGRGGSFSSQTWIDYLAKLFGQPIQPVPVPPAPNPNQPIPGPRPEQPRPQVPGQPRPGRPLAGPRDPMTGIPYPQNPAAQAMGNIANPWARFAPGQGQATQAAQAPSKPGRPVPPAGTLPTAPGLTMEDLQRLYWNSPSWERGERLSTYAPRMRWIGY